MEKKKFYITTPIYYPSDKLHIVNELLMLGFAVQKVCDLRVVQINAELVRPGLAVHAGEEQQLCLFPVVDAPKILAIHFLFVSLHREKENADQYKEINTNYVPPLKIKS